MMLAYEAILLGWLNLYGYVINRAGRSRIGNRVRTLLQGFTGVVLIALGVRLAFLKTSSRRAGLALIDAIRLEMLRLSSADPALVGAVVDWSWAV